VVIIWALLTAFMVAGIIISATEEMRAVDRASEFEFSANGQAEEVAQAGLVDAYAWFRRQKPQPVRGFVPKGLPPSLRDASTLPADTAQMPTGLRGTLPNGNRGQGKATAPGQTKKTSGAQTAHYKTIGDVTSALGAATAAQVTTELGAAEYYALDGTESETPELGLVRSFEISPGVWARYTVSKGIGGEAFEDANGNAVYDRGEAFTDLNGDGKWNAARATRDVSTARGLASTGTVWYLTSVGEIFKRPRQDLPLGAGPNTRLGRSVWGTEIRRLTISPPAAAALCVQDASRLQLGDRCRLRGDTAIAYSTGHVASGGELKGGVARIPDFDTSSEAVFGVSWQDLMSMADISTTDGQGGVPAKLPASGLVVVHGDITFNRARPLRGDAVLAVDGDVTIEGGSNSYFLGVLYVKGNLVMRGPAAMRGTVIVTGSADLQGGGGEFVEIEHDPQLLGGLLTRVAQYRHSKAPFRIRPKVDEGLPSVINPPPTPTPDPGPGPGPDKSGKPGDPGDPGDTGNPGDTTPPDGTGEPDPCSKTSGGGKANSKSSKPDSSKSNKSKSNKSKSSKKKSQKSKSAKPEVSKSGKSVRVRSKSGKSLSVETKWGKSVRAVTSKSGKNCSLQSKSGKSHYRVDEVSFHSKSGKSRSKWGDFSFKTAKSGKSCGFDAYITGKSKSQKAKSRKSGSPDGEIEPPGGCDGQDHETPKPKSSKPKSSKPKSSKKKSSKPKSSKPKSSKKKSSKSKSSKPKSSKKKSSKSKSSKKKKSSKSKSSKKKS